MSIITLQAVGNESPWAFGGDAVTSPTNTGHAMSGVLADDGNPNHIKSCQWGNFPALPAGALSARLKASWTYQNALNSSPDAQNFFEVSYSLIGELTSGNLGSRVVAFSVLDVTGGSSGTVDVALSLSQNMSNLYMMDVVQAVQNTPGFTSEIEAQVSNVRVEVEVVDLKPIFLS